MPNAYWESDAPHYEGDPLLRKIRAHKEEISARHNDDINSLLASLRAQEESDPGLAQRLEKGKRLLRDQGAVS